MAEQRPGSVRLRSQPPPGGVDVAGLEWEAGRQSVTDPDDRAAQLTLAENADDLATHADHFAARRGFAYTVLDGADEVIGRRSSNGSQSTSVLLA